MSLESLAFVAGGGDMGERIRAFDWAATSLGPMSEWPQGLKTAVRIMLTSRQPIWVGWGEECSIFTTIPTNRSSGESTRRRSGVHQGGVAGNLA